MSKTTQYTCIKALGFKGKYAKHGSAFTCGKTYEGCQDKQGSEGDIELTDDTGGRHTITAALFPTIFTECK